MQHRVILATSLSHSRLREWRVLVASLLWAVIVILVVLWLLGFLAVNVGGSLIHLLLVIAVIILIFQLFAGRRSI